MERKRYFSRLGISMAYTSLNPLDESAQVYKVVKESAMQLGLNIEEENLS